MGFAAATKRVASCTRAGRDTMSAALVAAALWAFGAMLVSLRLPAPLGTYRPVALYGALLLAYDVLPFVLVGAFPNDAEALLGGAFEYYTPDRLPLLVGFAAMLLSAVCAGQAVVTWLAGPASARRRSWRWLPSTSAGNRTAGLASFWILAIFAALLVIQLRDLLLGGYHESLGDDTLEVVQRGALSSVFMLMLVSYLFAWQPQGAGRPGARPAAPVSARLASTTVLLAVGLALLSLGGRLYVVSALLVVALLRASRAAPGPGSRRRTWIYATFALAAVAVIGVWRTQGDVSVGGLAINLLAEPGFVSISLASLFAVNSIPALHAPTFLIGDAVGVLPAFLYPDKLDRLFSLREEFDVSSPVGGLNGVASLVANFGWAGAIVVALLASMAASALCHWAARSPATSRRRFVVVVVTALPALSLFRDPFVISVYKNLAQNAIFFPLLLVVTGHVLSCAQRRPARHGTKPLAVHPRATA